MPPVVNSAESAYLFRHAVLRDAAYQLQLPGDRARLHALAFALMEDLFGGRPPEYPPEGSRRGRFHRSDPHALDLAEHARLAGTEDSPERKLYLRRGAERAERFFQSAEAVRAWLALAEAESGTARGGCLRRAGVLIGIAGRPEEAEEMLKRSLAAHRDAGDRPGEGAALSSLALVHYERGQVEASLELSMEALAVQRESGDRRSEGITLGQLASGLIATGRLEEAKQHLEQALAINRKFRNEGQDLGNMAIVHHDLGQKRESERLQRQALNFFRKAGKRRNEGVVWVNLAILSHEQQRFPEAERMYRRALALFREVGDPRHEAVVLGNLAVLQQGCERDEEAALSFRRAMALYQETGSRRGYAMVLGNYGKLRQLSGDFKEARESLEEAIAIHQECRNLLFEGSHTCSLALLSLAEGRVDEARAAWKKGASVLVDAGSASELERLRIDMIDACRVAGAPTLDDGPAV
jgi:tetratricopeptide (TPR) repeat protein